MQKVCQPHLHGRLLLCHKPVTPYKNNCTQKGRGTIIGALILCVTVMHVYGTKELIVSHQFITTRL
jgi:hypothetical protein